MKSAFWCGFVTASSLAASTTGLLAQEQNDRIRAVMSVSGGIYATSIGDPTVALGGGVALEKSLVPQFGLRLSVNAFRTIATQDAAFTACPPMPTCPIAVFPELLAISELQGIVAPQPTFPFRIVGGVGFAFPGKGRENYTGAPPVDSSAGVRATLRAGLELNLGRSSRSPRLQLSRTLFNKSIFSMTWLDAVTLALPF